MTRKKKKKQAIFSHTNVDVFFFFFSFFPRLLLVSAFSALPLLFSLVSVLSVFAGESKVLVCSVNVYLDNNHSGSVTRIDS